MQSPETPAAIVAIDPETDPRWDRFVAGHPEGTIYHLSAWSQLLRTAFAYPPLGLALAQDDDSPLEGILSLAIVNRWCRRKRVVSLPLTAYCEPLIPREKLGEFIRFARTFVPGIQHVHLQYQQDASQSLPGWPSGYVTHVLRLDGTEHDLLKRFHNSSVRQRIRRAEREGLTIRWGDSEKDIQVFYRFQRATRKKHGLPPHPFRFFDNMRRILMPQGLMSLPVVERAGEPIAAAILLNFNKTFHLEYSAADARYLNLCSNQFLIWQSIRKAHEEGASYFDFGRTHATHASLMEFKQRWATEERTILDYDGGGVAPSKARASRGRKCIAIINRGLPNILLDWQGRLVYRYLS